METLKYYLRLGGQDALLALPAAALLTLVFVLLTRKKREPDKREKLRWFLSFWYLCLLLLLVFLGGRVETRMPPFSAARLYPFDTLRRALISPDRSELTLLVLNVLSFVPFGLLLVRHARGREHGARLFWILPLLPLLIELTQFATGLGTLEIDDWIANTVGGAWGVCMGLYYANRKTKKARTWGALALLPLLIAALGAGLWLARPFGFLPEDFADPALPRPAEVEIESRRSCRRESSPSIGCVSRAGRPPPGSPTAFSALWGWRGKRIWRTPTTTLPSTGRCTPTPTSGSSTAGISC